MDFTREPIIETIITPRDGCKLVVRSSKSTGQEEYFVDAVEVISFGQALFFRSLERPKAFLVPINDYEILEVREARMVLKNLGPDRSIKIGGGKEASSKVSREEKIEISTPAAEELTPVEQENQPAETVSEAQPEVKLDKKRDRRRHYRKRRGGREDTAKEEVAAVEPTIPPLEEERVLIPPPEETIEVNPTLPLSSSLLSSLLQPPPTLISETINRYRENALFKNAFFLTEEEQYKPHDKVQELLNEDDEDLAPPLQEPTYEPLENSDVGQGFLQEEQFFKEEIVEVENEEDKQIDSLQEIEIKEEKTEEILSEDFSQETSLPLYAEEEDVVMEEEPYKENQVDEEQDKKFMSVDSENSDNHEKNIKTNQPDLPF